MGHLRAQRTELRKPLAKWLGPPMQAMPRSCEWWHLASGADYALLMPEGGQPGAEIGVTPSSEVARRRRLFRALERAYPGPLRPARGKSDSRGDRRPRRRPGLGSRGSDTRSRGHETARSPTARGSSSRRDPLVPMSFRGQTLVDEATALRPLARQEEATVLARAGRDVVWTARSAPQLVHRAGVAPAELADGESLRDRFRPRPLPRSPSARPLPPGRHRHGAFRPAGVLRHRRPQSARAALRTRLLSRRSRAKRRSTATTSPWR